MEPTAVCLFSTVLPRYLLPPLPRAGKQQTALAWEPQSQLLLMSGLETVMRNLHMASPPPFYRRDTEAQGGRGPGPTSPIVSNESEERP